MIRISSLHKYYNRKRQNEIHVINGVDLKLPERGMVAIFGKSGCGKTTLLNVIGGLDKFDSGALTVGGEDVTKSTDDVRNKYVGYIFQNYNLDLKHSSYENVAMALTLAGITDKEVIKERTLAALEAVGMEKFKHRTPDTLSGGQQQRIAIARAVVKNPPIILADEPTGNLDEANTVMIMDLLKTISRDHLVLLVTHEDQLVHRYCDKIIELSDGSIVSLKDNDAEHTVSVKNKNDIYLGDLEREEASLPFVSIDYFGDKTETPIKLRIVNSDGKIYLKADTPGVNFIDSSSEVCLRDEKYEEKTGPNTESERIDMSRLPPIQCGKCGRLFSFFSSFVGGLSSVRGKNKKGQFLLTCLGLFSAIIVFLASAFGTSIRSITDARSKANQNTFYVYTDTKELSLLLNDAMKSGKYGIDYAGLQYGYPYGDSYIRFNIGSFESFNIDGYSDRFATHAVFLPESASGDYETLEGKTEGLEASELVITTAVADALIKSSAVGHLKEYGDLIGLFCPTLKIDSKNTYIAGIVESDEPCVYLNELSLAKYIQSNNNENFDLASKYGVEVSDGECVIVITEEMGDDVAALPEVGSKLSAGGVELILKEQKRFFTHYDKWIAANGKEVPTTEQYAAERVISEHPDIDKGSDEYADLLAEACDKYYFDWCDIYYSFADEFLSELYAISPDDIHLWLYMNKEVEMAKYLMLDHGEYYYYAKDYKNKLGKYPTLTEASNNYINLNIKELIYNYENTYQNEFLYSYSPGLESLSILVSDNDYIAASRLARDTNSNDYYYTPYTVIHTKDKDATEAWLYETVGENTQNGMITLVTPDVLYENEIASEIEDSVVGITSLVILVVLMCVSMYFIMRSSLLGSIREIGILRAIGTKKSNIVFKFATESLAIATVSILPGYLFASLFITACGAVSPLAEALFYYPPIMALGIIVLLTSICVIFGAIPVFTLLGKTPSEILSKYDI